MGIGSAKMVRVLALTPAGSHLAWNISSGLKGSVCWLPERLVPEFKGTKGFTHLSSVVEEAFRDHHDLVCVMATGIVVRAIAPYLQGKDKDPAVVVTDEKGRFVVSLLSGHLGGANELARKVAELTGGTAVITTATDVENLPAFDLLAKEQGLIIENLPAVREIHMALLQGRSVSVVDPAGWLKEPLAEYLNSQLQWVGAEEALSLGRPTVYVGYQELNWPPEWLRLRPRELVLGIGCNRGTPTEELLGLIQDTFRHEGLSLVSVKAMATIDVKRNEPGLLEAARELGVELTCFPATELMKINVPHPSRVVARHVEAASVCEASALLAAKTENLIVQKRKTANVTLAVARAASQ